MICQPGVEFLYFLGATSLGFSGPLVRFGGGRNDCGFDFGVRIDGRGASVGWAVRTWGGCSLRSFSRRHFSHSSRSMQASHIPQFNPAFSHARFDCRWLCWRGTMRMCRRGASGHIPTVMALVDASSTRAAATDSTPPHRDDQSPHQGPGCLGGVFVRSEEGRVSSSRRPAPTRAISLVHVPLVILYSTLQHYATITFDVTIAITGVTLSYATYCDVLQNGQKGTHNPLVRGSNPCRPTKSSSKKVQNLFRYSKVASIRLKTGEAVSSSCLEGSGFSRVARLAPLFQGRCGFAPVSDAAPRPDRAARLQRPAAPVRPMRRYTD